LINAQKQECDTLGPTQRSTAPEKQAQSPIRPKYTIPRTALIPRKRQAYRDMFKRIMNNPSQNHSFFVTHLTKDCLAYHKRVVLEAERQIDQEGYLGDHDDDQGPDVIARSTMLIFGGPQAYKIKSCRS
jgi:hypothetical protein